MKVLGWIIAAIALVLVAVIVIVALSSGNLLERAMESYGTDYLGAPVEVGDVDVSFTEGSARIAGLTVGNPPGFSGPPAMVVEGIAVALDTQQTTSELVVLEEVTVDGAQVAALEQGGALNLKRIMDHLEERVAAGERAEETGVQSEVHLIIDRFSLTGASAAAESELLGQGTLTIPDVELSDVGRASNGATVGQVLQQVLEPIFQAVTRQLIEQGVDLEGARERVEGRAREEVEERLGNGLESLKDRFREQSTDQ